MLKMPVLYELGNAFKFHNNSHLTEKGPKVLGITSGVANTIE